MYNPFDGVTPNLGPFDKYLHGPISIILALIWAIAFVGAAAYLIPAAFAFVRARRSGRPHQAEAAMGDLGAPAITLVILALIPVIYVTLVNIGTVKP
ncbi:MAG TPA: hypothetical protein PLA44_14075 [Propionibacteriaceae bacterium]|nr:hypothetical protein [Propionibacteriaceae bacterium]